VAARNSIPPFRPWTLDTVLDRCDEVGECWIWKHSCKAGRNPQATIEGKTGSIVRPFIYDVLLKKPRPIGSTIGATCGEPKCCNPAHLVWKSRSDVIRSTYKSGARSKPAMTLQRRERAIRHGWAKLTMDKATEIRMRRAGGESTATLAAETGVGVSTIRAICRGRIWKPTGGFSIFNLGG